MDTYDVLLTLFGRDEASQVFQQVGSNAQATLGQIEQSADQSASSISQKFAELGNSISSGLHTVDMSLMSFESANRSILSSLGATKSAMDYVYGTTSTAETNQVLMKNWQDETATYEELYNAVDKITDKSLTSMQDLVPAMNAFKASTQATGKVMKDNVAEGMAQFGAYVLSLTGSQQLAKTAMTDLSKGLVGKGAFSALDQYGVTKETLMARGWSGKNEDIEGYMKAVREVSGAVEELMDTSQGVDALMGKMWSRAGKRIGKEALPGVVNLKQAFMDLDEKLDGDLSTSVLRVSLLIEEASQKAHTLNTVFMGMQNAVRIIKAVATWYGFLDTETKNSLQSKQAENQEIALNNELLATNTDLRFANAEAMGFQGTMGEGVSYEGGEYYSESSDGDWSSDVMANTAGGILESKYQRYRDDSQSLEGKLAENRSGDRRTITPKASPLSIIPLLQDNQSFSDAEKAFITRKAWILHIGQMLDADEDMMGVIEKEVTEAFTNPRYASAPSNNTALEGFRSFFRSATDDGVAVEKAVKDYGTHQKDLKTALKGLFKAEDELDDIIPSTGMFGASFQNDLHRWQKEALDQLDDLDGVYDGPFTRLSNFLNEKKKRKLPEVNLSSGLDGFSKSIGKLGDSITSKISNPLKRLKNKYDVMGINLRALQGDTKSETMDNVWSKLKNSFKGLRGAKEVEEGAEDVVKGTTNVVRKTEQIAEAGKGAGAIAPTMGEASSGLSLLGLSEMGLVGAFTTLIVPTLAIAGVIAILIPIIAGLVMEALFFIQLVGQFMSSLDFSFDLSGIAEKFQELGTALAWLGVAMGSLVFVGLMTHLSNLIIGISNVQPLLQQAMGMLKGAVDSLNQFQYSTQLDPNVSENLTNLGTALNGVSTAMLSLVGIQLISNIGSLLTGFGKFGTLAGTFQKAKQDIQQAINAINQMDFSGIDEGRVETIKTTLEAISAFADAFKGLNDIRTTEAFGGLTSWLLSGGLFGGKGKSIAEAFNSAHQDIQEASSALSQYTDIQGVDETTVQNLQSVGNSISAVADAINNMRGIRDAYNWDDMVAGIFNIEGKSLASIFETAKGDIQAVSKQLKDLSSNISQVPEDLPEKLNTVNSSITGVSSAVQTIQSIKAVKSEDMTKKMTDAVASVKSAITQLGTITGGKVSEQLVTTLTNVNNAVGGVANTIKSILQIPNVDGENVLNQRITNAVSSVNTAITELGKINKGSIGEQLTTTLTHTANGMKGISTVVHSALGLPMIPKEVLALKIKNAVDSVSAIIDKLSGLKGKSVGAEVNESLNQVKTAVANLKETLKSANFTSQGKSMGSTLKSGFGSGLSGMGGKISSALSAGVNSSGAFSKGTAMGSYMKRGFATNFKVADVVRTEMGYVVEAITSGGSAINGAMAQVASEAVEAFKSGMNTGSPGDIARTMEAEMGYTHGFIKTGGATNVRAIGQLASNLVQGFRPVLQNVNGIIDNNRINGLRNMNSNVANYNSQRPVSIMIGEGAIQLDARNLTTAESRQVMVNALEGLDVIQSVNIKGLQ